MVQWPVVVVGCPCVEYHSAAAPALLNHQPIRNAVATATHKWEYQSRIGAYFDRDVWKLDNRISDFPSLDNVNFEIEI